MRTLEGIRYLINLDSAEIEKEQGRRRFTMAHEASHHILSKMYAMPSEGRFHAG